MKTSKILCLTLEEFETELSVINHEYVREEYKSTLRALMTYQEAAELSGQDECLGINEFFDIDKENSKDYIEYLEELFGPEK